MASASLLDGPAEADGANRAGPETTRPHPSPAGPVGCRAVALFDQRTPSARGPSERVVVVVVAVMNSAIDILLGIRCFSRHVKVAMNGRPGKPSCERAEPFGVAGGAGEA